MTFSHIMLAFVGGGVGASLRLMTTHWAGKLIGLGFPYGTFAVNVIGSLLMGLLVAFLAARGQVFGLSEGSARVLLATGVLGGFTTFSAFSLDAMSLYQRGDIGLAMVYVGVSVVLAIAALALGLFLGRSLF